MAFSTVLRGSPLAAFVRIATIGSVACSSEATTSIDGATVFATYCATCHGPDGQPPAAVVARIAVRDLTSPELRARVTPDLVEYQVRSGSQNKLMPPFEGVLTDRQIKAVSAFVADPKFLKPR